MAQQLQLMFLVLLLFLAASPPVAWAQRGRGGNDDSRFSANAPIPGPDAPVLAGYDLVEYHFLQANQDGVLGKASISHRLATNGYLYYFSTEANRELFIQDPKKYLPKYGGYCAWGLAWKYEDDGWPWAANHVGPPCGPADGWAILSDGKLYCSIYRHYQDDFNSKQDEGIRLADERWMARFGSLTAGPQNNGCFAWNWQKCFARSNHTSLDVSKNSSNTRDNDAAAGTTPTPSPVGAGEEEQEVEDSPSTTLKFNVSQVLGDEAIATWSEPVKAMMGILTFQWTILDGIPSLDTSTTTSASTAAVTAATETVVAINVGDETQEQGRSPQIVVQLSATNISSNEYIAFGVAEQLMQGPLIACFSLDDDVDVDVEMDDGATFNVTSTCRTLRGNGMGTSILSDDEAREQRLNVQILWSTRNATHYTIRLAMSMLGLIPNGPRHGSMSRVVFCRGKISGDGSPQPHANNIWNRQAVTGIEWLSVLRNGNNTNAAADVENDNSSNSIDWLLPDQDLWIPVTGSSGVLSVLNDRVHVAYRLYRHYSNTAEGNSNNDLDDASMEVTRVQEIVEIQLQNVEYNADGYGTDDNMDSYIGFAFAKDTMTGLVITCSIGAGIDGESACKPWHGEGTNLYPISTNNGNGGGGWFVTGVAGNRSHANFTLAGRVADVIRSGRGTQHQQQQQQQTPFLSPDESSNLRAIISIGRSPSDTGNPLQHFPQDREAFQLDGLAAGYSTPLSIGLQDDDTSTTPFE